MKKVRNFIIILAGASMLASCSVAWPVAATANTIGGKRGVAERTIWFSISFGHTDTGIATAAKNGGISKVATVDYKVYKSFLGIKTTYSCIVTGE